MNFVISEGFNYEIKHIIKQSDLNKSNDITIVIENHNTYIGDVAHIVLDSLDGISNIKVIDRSERIHGVLDLQIRRCRIQNISIERQQINKSTNSIFNIDVGISNCKIGSIVDSTASTLEISNCTIDELILRCVESTGGINNVYIVKSNNRIGHIVVDNSNTGAYRGLAIHNTSVVDTITYTERDYRTPIRSRVNAVNFHIDCYSNVSRVIIKKAGIVDISNTYSNNNNIIPNIESEGVYYLGLSGEFNRVIMSGCDTLRISGKTKIKEFNGNKLSLTLGNVLVTDDTNDIELRELYIYDKNFIGSKVSGRVIADKLTIVGSSDALNKDALQDLNLYVRYDSEAYHSAITGGIPFKVLDEHNVPRKIYNTTSKLKMLDMSILKMDTDIIEKANNIPNKFIYNSLDYFRPLCRCNLQGISNSSSLYRTRLSQREVDWFNMMSIYNKEIHNIEELKQIAFKISNYGIYEVKANLKYSNNGLIILADGFSNLVVVISNGSIVKCYDTEGRYLVPPMIDTDVDKVITTSAFDTINSYKKIKYGYIEQLKSLILNMDHMDSFIIAVYKFLLNQGVTIVDHYNNRIIKRFNGVEYVYLVDRLEKGDFKIDGVKLISKCVATNRPADNPTDEIIKLIQRNI